MPGPLHPFTDRTLWLSRILGLPVVPVNADMTAFEDRGRLAKCLLLPWALCIFCAAVPSAIILAR